MSTKASELANLPREELVRRATGHMSQEQLVSLALQGTPPVAAKSSASPGSKRKKGRPFDMSRFAQRHIALRIAYIGTDYYGFAYQPDTPETVEGRLYEALEKTCLIVDRQSCRPSRGGRTDKGVSALGQVVALYARSNLPDGPGFLPAPNAVAVIGGPTDPTDAAASGDASGAGEVAANGERKRTPRQEGKQEEIDYVRVLNRVLPPDIRVLAWQPVPQQFSARFSATHRTYK